MTTDEFWAIVERVHLGSGGDMDRKCELLGQSLRELPAGEIQSFDGHFSACYYGAYTQDLWGAAYIICGGCSDDKFTDFRSTLISMGRAIFERAMADPESLAEQNIDGESAAYEGYQYVAYRVYEEKTGVAVPPDKPHPKRTRGVAFKEWELEKRFPKLVAKYGYKDSDWANEERRLRRRNKRIAYTVGAGKDAVRVARTLANLLLDSEIIPACGYIPPLPIVASVLRAGRFVTTAGKLCSWEGFKLDDADFWHAVNTLERLAPKRLKGGINIRGKKIQLDTAVPARGEYSDWIQSLRRRGLA